jgi:hypothetical protein
MAVRVETNGNLDASFGSGGITATIVIAGTGTSFPDGLAIQPNGKIVIALVKPIRA